LTDIARLEFSIETAGLKQGESALDDFKKSGDAAADSVKKVGDATKSSSSSIAASADQIKNAYGPALQQAIQGNTSYIASAGNVTRQLEQIVAGTGMTYEQAAAKIVAATAAQREASAVAGQAGGFWSSLGGIISGLIPTYGSHAAATKNLGAAHSETSGAMREFRETAHSIHPVLQELQSGNINLMSILSASRAGWAGLAAAIGGVVLVALGKARDEEDKLNFRLQAIAGEKNGEKIAADLKKAADAAGVMPGQMEPAVESALRLEKALQNADPHVIYAPGYNPFDAMTGGANAAVRAVQTVTEQFKLNKLDSAEAAKATNEFFDSIKKNSGLTAQEFDKLINQAPTFAAALAKAFGANNVYDFQKALEAVPAPLQAVFQAIMKIGPTTDQQFKQAQAASKSFGTEVDALKK
jgi:hypothetical protein